MKCKDFIMSYEMEIWLWMGNTQGLLKNNSVCKNTLQEICVHSNSKYKDKEK
jgi:hypothetical protein